MSNNSRTLNSSKTVLSGIFNKIVTLILTFVSRKIFIQYIGIEYLGIHSLFANVLTLLSLADLGFGIAMNYSLYKPLAENDIDKLSALMSFYKRVYNIIAIAIAVIGVCLTPFLKYIINLDSDIPYIYIYYLIALSNTVISYLFVYKSSIINADQKGYKINAINVRVNFGKIIAQIISMFIVGSYAVYALIEVGGTFINNLIISKQANKLYPYIKNKGKKLDDLEKKGIFKNLGSVFIYKLSGNIMTGTDSIIMSVIISTTAVGLYSNYLSITTNITALINIIFSSFTAGVGNLLVDKNKTSRLRVFKMLQLISNTMSSYICVCIMILVQDFISLWLGAEYQLDTITVIAIALNLYFTTCMHPLWTFRDASGLYQKTKYVMLITAALNIVLSILLGIWIGIGGIVIATALSRLLTYFWYEPRLLFKMYFEERPLIYYFDTAVNVVVMVICYLAVRVVLNIAVLPNTWIMWVLKAAICSAIIGIIYLIRYFWTSEFKELLAKVRAIVKKND